MCVSDKVVFGARRQNGKDTKKRGDNKQLLVICEWETSEKHFGTEADTNQFELSNFPINARSQSLFYSFSFWLNWAMRWRWSVLTKCSTSLSFQKSTVIIGQCRVTSTEPFYLSIAFFFISLASISDAMQITSMRVSFHYSVNDTFVADRSFRSVVTHKLRVCRMKLNKRTIETTAKIVGRFCFVLRSWNSRKFFGASLFVQRRKSRINDRDRANIGWGSQVRDVNPSYA